MNNRLVGNPMEPRAAIAEHDAATEKTTLWTTSQFPHVVRLLMGLFVLNIPQQNLRVVAPDVGGGFGVKQFHYAEEAVVTFAARKLGRAVKWVCERSEGFISDAHGRDHVTEAALALDADGTFLGMKVETIGNLGAYISTFGPNIPTNLYGAAARGRVHHAGHPLPGEGGVHQYRAGRCLSRRGAAGGDLRGRAPGRDRGHRRWASTRPRSAGAT